jgi:thiamine biosynthesis protein ThiS
MEGPVEIVVNGESRTVAPGTTVRGLVEELSLPRSRVAVERNRAIVRRDDFDRVVLAEGDRIEIVTFVGGG